MCKRLVLTRRKKVTVYKVVALKKNRRRDICYSLCTGMKYKIGNVISVKKQNKLINWTDDLLNPLNPWHSKNMIGRTSGFQRLKDARRFFYKEYKEYGYSLNNKYKMRIMKLTLSDGIMKGIAFLQEYPVFAGKHIDSIEILPLSKEEEEWMVYYK